MELICNGYRCGGGPRAPLRGTRLCAGCTRALAADLTALPGLHDQCGQLLGGSDSRPPATRTTGSSVPGLPFNTSAADTRAAILAITASWSGLVARERRITPPPRTVGDLARFLLRHLPWLVAHPAAPELSREIAETARAARQVADPQPLRRVRIGDCVEPGCPGWLTALVRSGGAGLSAEVVCSAQSAHRWPTQEWARLGSRLSQTPSGGCRWLGATEIAQLWRVSTGSVYRMASEHRWSHSHRCGRVYYSADDVCNAFAARAGA